MSHNEVYNLPYSGITIGYGWGANDIGGSQDYVNRGLYSYQPVYTTATTAANNHVTDNYIHDLMQQMTDGGCMYTLSASRAAPSNATTATATTAGSASTTTRAPGTSRTPTTSSGTPANGAMRTATRPTTPAP
ncbi:hypothetical protein GCM10011428_78880 [Streptomyces violaceus]|uniref:hypothetical protein n=1 Tax=Streptomyces violaceus TaxID=1936 RepID=UPI0031E910C8